MQGDVCPLHRERLRKPWTQQQLADFAQVSLSTVERAERGDPLRIDNIQRLCACLKKSPEQLGLLKIENEISQISTPEDGAYRDSTANQHIFSISVPSYDNVFQAHNFTATNMTACLWNLAFNDRCTSDEMVHAIQQAIEEFDLMNTDNQNYAVTRCEALCQLATLPIITLQLQSPGSTVHPRRYNDAITYCTVALEACWQLYRGSDPIGKQHAFKCVSSYVYLLGAIAKDSSHHRKEALDLAAQYALLQTMFSWQCAERSERVGYAQNALSLCKATGNILFQLSAYPKLSYTYITSRNYTMAWEKMQEGEHVLKGYQRKKNGDSLPLGVIGNFYKQ